MKKIINYNPNIKTLSRKALLHIQGGTLLLSPNEDDNDKAAEFKQGNDRVVRKKPGRTTY